MGSLSRMERARRAVDAMKALGFSKKEATPVLKRLLNLFDSWEPIEDENYRALADAILDAQNNGEQEQEHCRHSTAVVPHPQEDDHDPYPTPLAIIGSSCDMDCETDKPRIKRPTTSTNFTADCSIDPLSPPSTMEALDDTMPISPLGASCKSNRLQARALTRSRQSMEDGELSSVPAHKKARQMMDEDFQHAVFLKEPKPEPDMDDIQCNADVPSCQNQLNNSSSSGAAHPLALLPPDQYTLKISGSNSRARAASTSFVEPANTRMKQSQEQENASGSNGRARAASTSFVEPLNTRMKQSQEQENASGSNGRARAVSTSFVEPENTRMKQPQEQENASGHAAAMQEPSTGSAVKNALEAPSLHTVVASSITGEVQLSLKCSIDPSNIHMPDLEAIFKMVEEKYYRSYKVILPNFSIGSLMNEICQCVSQMGNYDTGEDNINADAVDNGRNRQNESMTYNALSLVPIAFMNSGSEKDQSIAQSLVMEASQSGTANTQEPHLTLSCLRPIHDVSDISKGEEKVRISVVNDFGREKSPSFFYYTPRNMIFQKAHVNISVARIGSKDCCVGCFGNCLSAPVPCSCARETGGEFAYTPDGLVRTTFLDECVAMTRFPETHHKFFCKSCLLERSRNEASPEPCRGHLVRKFIKECWTNCGCNKQCGNRVVQRGMTCNLQVFFTQEGKGWGLRTLDELPKGTFVCEFVGELLTVAELHERTSHNVHNGRYMYPMLLDANWGSEGALKDEEALCLDATFYGNVGRFINHRCYDANLVEIPVEVETPDHHYYRVAFFTTKKVEAFEELTFDYGIDFDDNKHPVKSFECLCGSRYCRGRKHLRKRGKAGAK